MLSNRILRKFKNKNLMRSRKTTVKMRVLKIIKLEVIILFILVRYSLEDMLSSKSSVGDISQLYGYAKILNMILMLLSKSKKVPHIILKLPMMKLKFFKKLPVMPLILNGLRV